MCIVRHPKGPVENRSVGSPAAAFVQEARWYINSPCYLGNASDSCVASWQFSVGGTKSATCGCYTSV